jgi:hypothetical protein
MRYLIAAILVLGLPGSAYAYPGHCTGQASWNACMRCCAANYPRQSVCTGACNQLKDTGVFKDGKQSKSK